MDLTSAQTGPVGMLLPAVMAAREAARRRSIITFSDILVSSWQSGGPPGGG